MPRATSTRFIHGRDIEDFFRARTSLHFLSWFNQTLAGRPPWQGVRLLESPRNQVLFRQFWNRIPQIFGAGISAAQFAALMSIIANETRGDFFPRAEKIGSPGHPGMSYLFDRIPGRKRSYNTLAGNRTGFECFHDPDYLAAHGSLPLADLLARTSDARWSGDVWPSGVPTATNPEITGFITQADFMKFRGRGFLQTTGRANYLPLVRFVQEYQGADMTLNSYRARWRGLDPECAAFASTNADWDRLFRKTGLEVACEAIRLHNASSGHYLALSEDPDVLNSRRRGSLFYMGLRVSGGVAYAELFARRAAALLAAL